MALSRWETGAHVGMVCHAAAVVGKMNELASKGRWVACSTRNADAETSAANAARPSSPRYRSVPVVPSALVYGTGTPRRPT